MAKFIQHLIILSIVFFGSVYFLTKFTHQEQVTIQPKMCNCECITHDSKKKLVSMALVASDSTSAIETFKLGPGNASPRPSKDSKANPGFMILAAVIDDMYLHLALNFYRSSIVPLNLADSTTFLCVDKNACAEARQSNMTTYQMLVNSSIKDDYGNYRSKGFKAKSKLKLKAVHKFLKRGFNVILTDLDMTFMKSPISYLLDTCGQSCDLLLQTEVSKPLIYNTGFYYARSNIKTIKFFEDMLQQSDSFGGDDQDLFNRMIRGQRKLGTSERCAAKNKTCLRVMNLPQDYFQNGMYFGEKNTNHHFGINVDKENIYIVHHNFIVGIAAKEYRMKEAKMWNLDHEKYYSDNKGRYITYSQFEKDNTTAIGIKYKSVMLNNREIKLFKRALAVAVITNRILILPKFHSPDGFEVPLQFKLLISRFFEEFGNVIRESTFLEHPLVPKEISSPSKCDITLAPHGRKLLGEQYKIDDRKLFLIFEKYKACPIVNVNDLAITSIYYEKKLQQEKFERKLQMGIIPMNNPIQIADSGKVKSV